MPGDQPNFLFLLPDQHRPDFLPTTDGLPVRMPTVARLAAEGVRFTNATTPSPLCAPARACLAGARDYQRCGVANNDHDFPLDQPTYYQRLRDAGYRVAGVGKFDLHKPTHDWGADGTRLIEAWGFTEGVDNEGKIDAINSGAETPKGPYMAYLHARGLAAVHVKDLRRQGYADTHPTPLPDDAYCDNWLTDNGLELLRAFPAGRPWHLVVNFTGPHSPMDVTQRMYDRWRDVDFPLPNRSNQHDAATHVQIRRNYAAMLENIDRNVGRLIDAVRDRGELDRTIVVYSSDHGDMLGDHNRWGKCSYHQPSVGVPLVAAGPGVAGGRVCDAPVQLHDLAATFLEWAGADPLPEADSRSLVDLLAGGGRAARELAFSGLDMGKDEWRSVFDGRHKLVRSREHGVLLFDRTSDPLENTNIADRAPDVVARLGEQLDAWLQGTHPTC